ncbi:MAG: hypothetical protein U9Q81_04315 [Pseudomonadota bacterium]|nr:hypothetical protein [Pseudomonadota bacterium]
MICAAATLGTAFAVQAGAPKPDHPCYEVADCKTQDSRKAFSACIKAHKEEAAQNEKCAGFRKDKEGWMKENGMSNLDELFDA